MGKAFLCKSNGGGGGLAFRVIGGTSAPSNPKPNDIWVNTNEKITSYIFSATEPEGYAQGMVWISVGTSSTIEFNALKKNSVMVYPVSAKQYVSGEWVSKNAMTYQNGKWVEWVTYLFNYGQQDFSWVASSLRYSTVTNGGNPNVANNADGSVSVTIDKGSSSYNSGVYRCNDLIDFAGKTTLKITLDVTGSYYTIGLTVYPANADAWGADKSYGGDAVAFSSFNVGNNQTAELNVSGLTGKYYVGIGILVSSSKYGGSFTLKQLILE